VARLPTKAGESLFYQAEQIASRLRFNPEFGQKVADEIQPGTTVVVTDQPVVRKPKSDSSYFAVN
jgi:hypothetical protein